MKPEKAPLPEEHTILQLKIHSLSSSGDGLAYSDAKDHVYLVPFTLPGDLVEAKVYKHLKNHSMTDFVKVVTPAPQRNDSLIFCQYFAKCGGCQFQMLPYEEQLLHKKHVIEKAFENYSGLEPTLVPEVGPTWASPLQKGYRTKLTPHFDGPRRGGFPEGAPTPDVGFQQKGTRRVIDIEDCPIGTPALREGLTKARKFVAENLQTYKRGATILLRESTDRTLVADEAEAEVDGKAKYIETKQCITDPKAVITEYIGKYKFESPAGSFFQNNNSILEEFTTFIRSNLYQPADPTSPEETKTPSYLVDAYCGSGLFSITCGSPFTAVIGVDVSPEGIQFASRNATLNNLTNTTFLQGDAEKIFEKIDFPGEHTTVIIDPPRKGSDAKFLDQLLDLRPKRIVYISCNVHTQARDLGYFLRSEKGAGYKIDSVRGFDFFPQTHHVESIAVLTRYTTI
ncbi:S-adenosyl-L-methionine-dependent methyltransferase [Peziza echinospora]|nr:S-adenosyl-L-methionine-dependent methyltransferase [Peziza echinospora]